MSFFFKKSITKIFTDIPALETERLVLRKITLDDIDDMYDYSRREEVTKYLLWYPHQNRDVTKKHIIYLQKKYAAGEFYDWGIVLKKSGKFIGTCGFTTINERKNYAEVGYVISPDFQRQGIAPEALYAVLDFGFNILNLDRIEAKHMLGNDASAKVMKKCHMSFEKVLPDSMYVKDSYKTIIVYSVTKNEFLAAKNKYRLLYKI